jgi:hypothetical protein
MMITQLVVSSLLLFAAVPTNTFVTRSAAAFVVVPRQHASSSFLKAAEGDGAILTRVSKEDEGVAIPFLDTNENAFIECYADSVVTVSDAIYTIGVPCDYCVALCYFEGDDTDNLIPVKLHDALMDDIFPVAENIVQDIS